MDLVDYDPDAFVQIEAEYFGAFATALSFKSITAIPLSALQGDNVIERSWRTPWYSGPTLLGYLETVEIASDDVNADFRLPVQWVNRPNSDFQASPVWLQRAASPLVMRVQVLPGGQEAIVETLCCLDQSLPRALPKQSVTLTLDRQIDISRGDVIVAAGATCEVSDQFDTSLVWMDQNAGYVGRGYNLMLGGRMISATLTEIKYKVNINTPEQLPSRSLALNDIGRVSLSLTSL